MVFSNVQLHACWLGSRPELASMASSSGQDLVLAALDRASTSSGRRSSGDMDSLEGPDGPNPGEELTLWLEWLLVDMVSVDRSELSHREML